MRARPTGISRCSRASRVGAWYTKKVFQRIGNYLKDIVYGANDGIITTFAVVAGASGASLPPSVIVIIGIANLLGDGVSMAASNYLGTRSEHLMALQKDSGFVHVHRGNELIPAIVTFFAFAAAGFLPIIPFLFLAEAGNTVTLSIIATASALFVVGAMRSFFTRRNVIRSGVEKRGVGGVAAGAAYAVGRFVSMFY
ncbi:MAG: VIT1/CCC1 transporter family protein [Candidatus Liptonbacteria bacterium]|nr:VIT1/CCC1 transporter family protein [Candidatus Liptonbacteria bacterium]